MTAATMTIQYDATDEIYCVLENGDHYGAFDSLDEANEARRDRQAELDAEAKEETRLEAVETAKEAISDILDGCDDLAKLTKVLALLKRA